MSKGYNAGHETSAHSLSFLLYCLAKNPLSLSRLQAELDTSLPPNTSPSLATVNSLEYFSCCLRESQRLYPVAPILARSLDSDLRYNSMTLPAQSRVIIHLYGMGRQPWIDRADEFLPERWLSSSPQVDELKEMLTPFSVGKRSCIGQNLALLEIKVLGAALLRNFEFKIKGDPSFEFFVTLKPANLVMEVMCRD
jgi:cytochrome P450